MVGSSQFFDAVFFDMDGLMVDSEPEWFKSETEVTAKFDYAWSEEDQIACLGGPLASGAYLIAVPHLVTVADSPKVRVISSLEQMSFAKLQKLFSDFAAQI